MKHSSSTLIAIQKLMKCGRVSIVNCSSSDFGFEMKTLAQCLSNDAFVYQLCTNAKGEVLLRIMIPESNIAVYAELSDAFCTHPKDSYSLLTLHIGNTAIELIEAAPNNGEIFNKTILDVTSECI